MNEGFKTVVVLSCLASVFLALAVGFRLDLWGRVQPLEELPLVDPAFTNTASMRQSVGQLLEAGADPSDWDCYICHEEGKPPVLTFGTNNIIVLPEEHSDLRMRHGRRNRNDNCYNCHDPANLTKLKTRDGHLLELKDSTALCASCHGPTQRDWELGVHGRRSGYWDLELGDVTLLRCASCHDPHAPAIAPLEPAPAPHRLHPVDPPLSEEGNH